MKVEVWIPVDDVDDDEEYKLIFRTMVDICNLAKMTKSLMKITEKLDRKEFKTIKCPFPKVRSFLFVLLNKLTNNEFSLKRELTRSQILPFPIFIFQQRF